MISREESSPPETIISFTALPSKKACSKASFKEAGFSWPAFGDVQAAKNSKVAGSRRVLKNGMGLFMVSYVLCS
jgi:hypothetical protein